MNILCMNYEYPPVGGGGGTACKDLAERLAGFGHRIDVVTSAFENLPWEETVNGVRLHRVRCVRRRQHYVTTPEMLTQILSSRNEARRLMSQYRYALNHTHFIVPSGLASYLLWRETGLPYVITIHGSDVPGYNPDRFRFIHKLIAPVWRRILRNAACVVSPSRYLQGLLQQQIDLETEIIPNGIDFPPARHPRKENRILLVTRMFERKGVQFFLEAIRNLTTDWEISIAGDGPYLPRLRELARDMRPRIDFLGFIRGTQLTDLYHSAKVFVFPSCQENFPVVLLEAMSAGCAVITTSASGCAEVVEDAAIQVPPADPPALRRAVERVLHDDEEIERLSRRGLERVDRFRSETVARRYEQLFRRLIS
jgi:glycosyltransferase involved in cell wall biosynthesis